MSDDKNLHKIVYGIDHSKGKDETVVVGSRIVGNTPDFIIIDEYHDLKLSDYHDWLLEPDYPKPIQNFIEENTIKKNGKMVKRHHPIPQTPRSPRKRR